MNDLTQSVDGASGFGVLFVDDEEHIRLAARQTLELADMPVAVFEDGETALTRVARDSQTVLVTDIRMAKLDGLGLMRRALEIDPEYPVILITGHGDVALAVQSMRDGAYDFIEKPYAASRLVDAVRRALEKRRLTIENRALRRQVGGRDEIEARLIGRSARMTELRNQLRAVAATDTDVLITGPTGTGKEVAARSLHHASARAHKTFVHINCAALPETLIEDELFGHEAGAFPGAMRARYGKFEHGRGGTVFLDEIDSLPLSMQTKLLTVLASRSVTRLGSNDPIKLDLRIVAASKVDLEAAAAEGTFRSDLLYRLNTITLAMPTLAERREDVPGLFLQLAGEAALRAKLPAPDVPKPLLNALLARDWLGNLRELKNAADRFVLGLDPVADDGAGLPRSLAEQVAAHEKDLIAASIAAHNGRLKDTYLALGLSRKTLYEKMQKYGLSREDFTE